MKKIININLLQLSILLNIIIPYFQKFDFTNSKENYALGFPFRFLSIQKKLKGDSLFSSFDIDLGSLILSIITIYLILYLIFVYIPIKYKSKKRNEDEY